MSDSEKNSSYSSGAKETEKNSGTAPRIPENLLSETKPAFNTNLEWETDRRLIADAKQSALDRFLKASIIQRADLLRDTLAVAVTILFGALTLYFASAPNHEIIKTKAIFFASLAIIAGGIVSNLIARAEIVRHLQEVSFQIEKNYLNLYTASRTLLANPTTTNIDTAWRYENEILQFPNLRKRGDYGHTIAIWTIVIGVLGLAFSLLLNVSF